MPIAEKHHAFITSNWLAQYRHNQFPPFSDSGVYYTEHHKLIHKHLSGVVATSSDDPDQFLGFLCHEAGVIHFAFVKEVFRRFGIARMMWEAAGKPTQYSHNTKIVRQIIDAKFQFNPYAFYKE